MTETVRRQSYRGLMLASLRYRNFRLVWLGSLTEHFGEFMEIAAILWLVNGLTHSPFMLTLVGSARFMPMILFPMVGGVVADRVNRRSMLISALLASSLLSILLAALVFSGAIAVWHLFVINLLSGVAMSFNHPARQSIVPNLIKREHLLNAMSLDAISVQASMVISMPIAGYLIAAVGVWPIFVIRAGGCFLAIVWLLLAMIPPTPSKARQQAPGRNLAEGFRYMRGNMMILGLVVLYLIPWLASNTSTNFLPVFANDILGVGARGYGYLQAASGLGAILSLIMLTTLTYYRHQVRLLVVASLILGTSLIIFSASPWFLLSLALLVVFGAMQNAFVAINTALIQDLTVDEMRGRVMSWREVAFGLGPTGSLTFGAIAQHTGVSFSLGLLGGVILAVSVFLITRLPRFRSTR